MEGSSGIHAPYDIENPYISLVTSVRKELNSLSPQSSNCCIFRIPERLRRVSKQSYTPEVVSIGPLHHGREGLKVMEEHKKRYLRDFISRTGVSLEDCIKKIKDQEARLRDCYAEPIEFSSDEFVRIILVDAAFIIELLLRHSFLELGDDNYRMFEIPTMISDIWDDLVLLENQLPFFILEDLFYPYQITHSSNISIISLSYRFFEIGLQIVGVEENNLARICSPKVEHFVDFIRTLYLQPLKSQTRGKRTTITTPSITELHGAGVKFKVESTKNLFDIQFSGGILKIPKLKIVDETERVFRNLIAFEQYNFLQKHIIDYSVIMDGFVNTPKDVELLVKYGIVEHWLGDSNEVSTLINRLAIEVTANPDDFHYATLCEDLNKYCRKSWHKWNANLRQNYFNTPWATMSIIAAVFLLILTLIQTVCSVISVTQASSNMH